MECKYFDSKDRRDPEKSQWIITYAKKHMGASIGSIDEIVQILDLSSTEVRYTFLSRLKNAWRTKKYKATQAKKSKKSFNILLPTKTIAAIARNARACNLTQSEYIEKLVEQKSELSPATPNPHLPIRSNPFY